MEEKLIFFLKWVHNGVGIFLWGEGERGGDSLPLGSRKIGKLVIFTLKGSIFFKIAICLCKRIIIRKSPKLDEKFVKIIKFYNWQKFGLALKENHGVYKNEKIKIPDFFQTFFSFTSVNFYSIYTKVDQKLLRLVTGRRKYPMQGTATRLKLPRMCSEQSVKILLPYVILLWNIIESLFSNCVLGWIKVCAHWRGLPRGHSLPTWSDVTHGIKCKFTHWCGLIRCCLTACGQMCLVESDHAECKIKTKFHSFLSSLTKT